MGSSKLYGAPREPWGGGALQGLCTLCPPPGRRDEDSDHPSPVVAKCCPATPHRTLQPSPHQASPSPGLSAPKGSSTHQPTHSSAATGQRRSHVSRFSGNHEKAPGTSEGERGVGRTLSNHGVRRHHPWALEGLLHPMSAGPRDFAGDLPHPLHSKQPLSLTQGTAGVLGAGNPWGQRRGARRCPQATKQPHSGALQGAVGAAGASAAPCRCRLKIYFLLFLLITLSLWLQWGSWPADHLQCFGDSPPAPRGPAAFC